MIVEVTFFLAEFKKELQWSTKRHLFCLVATSDESVTSF